MKFAVFTAMIPEYTVSETAALLSECGYDGVEWRLTEISPEIKDEPPSFWGNNRSTVDANASVSELQNVRRLTEDAGLQICNLACYLKFGDLESVERDMRSANVLGASSIRVRTPDFNRSENYHDLYAKARRYLSACQELSRQYNVKALIEIHMGNITPSASLAHRLIQGLDPACVGVIYDPGNMVYEGYENYRMGLQLLGDYLAHVHVKNTIWKPADVQEDGSAPLWQPVFASLEGGIVHWKQVIVDLKAVGYDGWLSMEDFSRSKPAEILLRSNLAYIQSLL